MRAHTTPCEYPECPMRASVLAETMCPRCTSLQRPTLLPPQQQRCRRGSGSRDAGRCGPTASRAFAATTCARRTTARCGPLGIYTAGNGRHRAGCGRGMRARMRVRGGRACGRRTRRLEGHKKIGSAHHPEADLRQRMRLAALRLAADIGGPRGRAVVRFPRRARSATPARPPARAALGPTRRAQRAAVASERPRDRPYSRTHSPLGHSPATHLPPAAVLV